MRITVITDSKVIKKEYDKEISISDILNDCGFNIAHPCGKNGKCGKCKIKVTGELSEITTEEISKLTDAEIKSDIRLACAARAVGDVTLYYNGNTAKIQTQSAGYMPKIDLSPITSKEDCYGAAIDIGTTTIAAYFYKFPEGICIMSDCVENPQSKFGADVISRIEYSNNGGLEELRSAVQNAIDSLCERFGNPIDTFVVTGNTTMLHILNGLDPKDLAVAPFTPKTLFGIRKNNIYFPKCISAFVGADITTAILASDMTKSATSLLIDIGTNGEMVLYHNGKLSCCSTAAGPAFEGAGISCGMPAVSGAIDHIEISQYGKISYTTIDNAKPIGLCGSGLLDAIACMLELGITDETGYIDNDFEIGDSGITITSDDIRQVQLAKAAIRAGLETLCEYQGCSAADIERFYIAGGFGCYVNQKSCVKIGLIPKELEEKAIVIGNAAGSGASMILMSSSALEKSEKIADSAEHIELSGNSAFSEKYMDALLFK